MILTFMEEVNRAKQGKTKLEEIEFARNEKGEIVGWKIKNNIVLAAKAGILFEATVVRPPENKAK